MEEEEEHVIARFLGALRPEISDVVHLQQYWTYTDVCRLALKVEKQLKSRGRLANNRFSSTSRPPTVQTAKSVATKVDTITGNTSNPSTPRVIRCFKCQGLGHLARECPNKQLVTFVEETTPVYDSANDEEGTSDGEVEVAYADHGDTLITQRVLNVAVSQTVDDSSWLRNNISTPNVQLKERYVM